MTIYFFVLTIRTQDVEVTYIGESKCLKAKEIFKDAIAQTGEVHKIHNIEKATVTFFNFWPG